jgi:hypothetical protein
MNFLEQIESAEDRTELYMENNPSLKLRAKLLLSWLKDWRRRGHYIGRYHLRWRLLRFG